MAGDPTNAAVWANADVYIGALDAAIPAPGAPFGADWDAVGLLNGDDGFTESMGMDTTDFNAWGAGIIFTTRKNLKVTRQFTAYEDNETVFDLWYPGHDVTFDNDGSGGYSGDIYVPDLQAKFKIAFETRSGDVIKRVISANYAQVDDRGDNKEGESDLASRPFTVIIYPAAADVDGKFKLFSTYRGPALTVESIDVTPATTTKAPNATQQLSVTATFSDSSTATVTNDCSYSTSAPSKATVDQNGLITAVATGSATITATYGGQTDTCAVTVS